MFFRIKFFLFICIFYSVSWPSYANDYTPHEIDILTKASKVLSNIKMVSGNFIQISHQNTRSTGKFYVRRPNKLRFIYDSPHNIVIISNGTQIQVNHPSKNKSSKYPLSLSPINSFLGSDTNLIKSEYVQNITVSGLVTEITLQKANSILPIKVKLIFTDNVKKLHGWHIFNIRNQVTKTTLKNIKYHAYLDEELFIISSRKNKHLKR